MNTELPEDEKNEEQTAAEQASAAETTPEPEETVTESVEVVEAVEIVVDAPVETPAEAPAAEESSVEQEATTPQLTLGDTVSDAASEETEEKPYVEPKIRGRIDKFGTAMGTGRRKTSVARVRIKEGSGKFVVNGRPLEDYFCLERDQKMIKAPLNAVEELGKVDVWGPAIIIILDITFGKPGACFFKR